MKLFNINVIFFQKAGNVICRKSGFADVVVFRIDGKVKGCSEIGMFEQGVVENSPGQVAVFKISLVEVGFSKIGFFQFAVFKACIFYFQAGKRGIIEDARFKREGK